MFGRAGKTAMLDPSSVYCTILKHIKLVWSLISQSGVAEVGATPLLFGLCPRLWQTAVIFTPEESLCSQLLKKTQLLPSPQPQNYSLSVLQVLFLWKWANQHWFGVSMATQMTDINPSEMVSLTFDTGKMQSYFPWRHLPPSEEVMVRIFSLF